MTGIEVGLHLQKILLFLFHHRSKSQFFCLFFLICKMFASKRKLEFLCCEVLFELILQIYLVHLEPILHRFVFFQRSTRRIEEVKFNWRRWLSFETGLQRHLPIEVVREVIYDIYVALLIDFEL
jgi:hypothetical protein